MPSAPQLGKYNTVALIYDRNISLSWNKALPIYTAINTELSTSLREMGYFGVYTPVNAKKAGLWIFVKIDAADEWFVKKLSITVTFMDARTRKKFGSLSVAGGDNSGPPVLVGIGGYGMMNTMMAANTLLKGPMGNCADNAAKEVVNYIKSNQ